MTKYTCIHCGEDDREHLIITPNRKDVWCETCGKIMSEIAEPKEPHLWGIYGVTKRDVFSPYRVLVASW